MSHTLSLTESLCGFQFTVDHLDGRTLVVGRGPGEVVPSGNFMLVAVIFVLMDYRLASACLPLRRNSGPECLYM